MATQDIANWVSELSYSKLPQSVVESAVRSFQNILGCIVGGSNHPTTQRALKALRPISNSSICTAIAQSTSHEECSLRLDLQTAVLVNGIASHVHDYDDTHLSTVIHPAGAIAVSLIAFAEHMESTSNRSVSGQEFITAFIAGIETSLRVGNAVSPNHYDQGWHITGSVSSIGAAAAISNLLRLDAATTVHALGIAATQVTGIRVHFGTDTKAFHVGRAAQNGITAAVLAEGGFTAATDALEGRRGWIEVVGNGADTLQEEVNGLHGQFTASAREPTGKRPWEIEKNTFKPFPCGIVIHPIIDACIQLHEELDMSKGDLIAEIERVDLQVHHLVLDLTGKKTPKDGLEAKFSVYHGATVGLMYGSATPEQYKDSIVNHREVTTLRAKVNAKIDSRVRSDEAHVKVTMKDGNIFTKHIEHAVGSLANPMTSADLEAKFMNQTEPILGKAAALRLNELAWSIVELEDIGTLVKAAY